MELKTGNFYYLVICMKFINGEILACIGESIALLELYWFRGHLNY